MFFPLFQISNSLCPFRFNPCNFFPPCFCLLHHLERNVKLYICRNSGSCVEGEGAVRWRRGRGDMAWPAFLGLNVRDLLKCQQGFDAGVYATEAKGMIFTFLSKSEKYSHNYCWACIDSTLNPFESICMRVDALLCVAWCWYAVACTHGHISKTAKTGGR